MPPVTPIIDIQESCLRGVNNAFESYYKWSGGLSLSKAPESFIQSEMARELAKVSPYVTLEDTVRSVLKAGDALSKGRLPRNRKGRIDIITWYENESPRILVEIKMAWQRNAINKDATRLRQILSRGGSYQEAIIVVYTSAGKPQTIDNRFKTIAENSESSIACRLGVNHFSHIEGGSWCWDAACFSIKT